MCCRPYVGGLTLAEAFRVFLVQCCWALVGLVGLSVPFFQAHPMLLFCIWWIGFMGIMIS